MRFSTRSILLIPVMLIGLPHGTALADDCTPPVSKEVSYFAPSPEVASAVVLKVWGIGDGGNDRERNNNGIIDAKKAACWHVLFAEPDNLLRTRDMRLAFEPLAESFWCLDTISNFITSVSPIRKSVQHGPKGKQRKVLVEAGVNIETISTWLADHNIAVTLQTRYTIMVLPWVPRGENPLAELEADPKLRSAANVIQQHFPPHRYEVKNPSGELRLQEVIKATDLVEDNPDDYHYRIALSQGADIYLTYEITINPLEVHGQKLHQAEMRLEAYETATAKMLGTQTGYSDQRAKSASEQMLIEEAFAKATHALKAGMQEYWFDCLTRGTPFRVVVKLPEDLDRRGFREIQRCYAGGIESLFTDHRETATTRSVMDFMIWANPEQFANLRNLEDKILDWMDGECAAWTLDIPYSMVGKFYQGAIVAND